MGDLELADQAVISTEDVRVGTLTLSDGSYTSITDYTSTNDQGADQTNSGTLGTVNSNGTFSIKPGGAIDGIIVSSTESVVVDNENQAYPIIQVVKQ